MKSQDQQVAAAVIVEDRAWLGRLQGELHGLLAGVFAQARSRFTAFAYIGALLAVAGDRKSCWQLAEEAGHATPRRMQALLAECAWDWREALQALQRFIVARLGDPEAIVVLDETAELKKGTATIGVGRQHAGITGQVENCQTVVFAAYVTARAHALFDFRLYLPKQWCGDRERRDRAHVPDEVAFTTKPALGTQMVAGAAGAGVPFAWVAADEVYGRSSKLREACGKAGKGYVLAVPVNFQVMLPSGRKMAVAAVAGLVPETAWETRSCGRGCKGHRDYAWAWAATASPRHWVLIRRSLSDPDDLAFFYCHAPEGRPVSLTVLIRVAGKRWPVEECLQQGKGQAGLDQHQVRLWHSFCRHTVLSMCAQALLAIAAARPAPPGPDSGEPPAAGQPVAWHDTGKLPATANDDRPGSEPGLVKVSVPEARRLARLAAAPMTATARSLGYAWSRWRRRHQARARWHHYHAQLKRRSPPDTRRKKGGPHVTNRDCSTGPRLPHGHQWRQKAVSGLKTAWGTRCQGSIRDGHLRKAPRPGDLADGSGARYLRGSHSRCSAAPQKTRARQLRRDELHRRHQGSVARHITANRGTSLPLGRKRHARRIGSAPRDPHEGSHAGSSALVAADARVAAVI